MPWTVPVFVRTAAGIEHINAQLPAGAAQVQLSVELRAPAQRVEVDPQFQVYRRLSPLETPPALSQAFGAARVLIVVPADGSALWAGLLKAWRKDGVEVVEDSRLSALPADRAVWLLGADNKFAPQVHAALQAYGAGLDGGALRLPEARYAAEGRSLVAAVHHPLNVSSAVVWLAASSEAAATALARKLPHYGRYSWLVFAGDEAVNQAKGLWPAANSPLVRDLVAGALPVDPAPRKALAEMPPGLAKGAAVLKEAADYLASRPEPLRFTGTPAAGAVPVAAHQASCLSADGGDAPCENGRGGTAHEASDDVPG